jgi:hypothetical protein
MRLGVLSTAIQEISRRVLLPVAFLFCAVIVEANGQNTRATPSAQNHPVMVTRLYTGADGQSRIDQVPVVFRDASGAAVRGFRDPLKTSAAVKTSDAYLVQGAPGTVQTWHNADRKRFIVVISGEAEVTTTDGKILRLVPGATYLAEDLAGKGHIFRVVGNKSRVALFVNFAQ